MDTSRRDNNFIGPGEVLEIVDSFAGPLAIVDAFADNLEKASIGDPHMSIGEQTQKNAQAQGMRLGAKIVVQEILAGQGIIIADSCPKDN
jgi:hypothetical protein